MHVIIIIIIVVVVVVLLMMVVEVMGRGIISYKPGSYACMSEKNISQSHNHI